MRILFLTQTYPRFEEDIAGPFIRDLARGLVRGGDHVTVLAPRDAQLAAHAVDAQGVEVRTFPYAWRAGETFGYGRSLVRDERPRTRALLAAPLYAAAARRAVRRLAPQYDLVQAHWLVPNAAILGSLPVPLAIGLHGSDVFLAENAVYRPLARRALARAAVVTGPSPELVARVCQVGFPAERAHVIPYGVDPERFSPGRGGDAARAWRERLGIPASAPMLLTVGRLVRKKGFHVLAAALPELLSRVPAAHVVVAGEGDLREELRAATAPFAARTHFPGRVLRDALPDLYRAADAFVLPAVHDRQGNVDGLPNVILEAMATGLPVVASDISGIPLAIDEGVEGRLVPEADPVALASALASLLLDDDSRRMMGAAARRRVESQLNWDAIAARYRAAYQAALH